jgi:hypothetical protein
LCAFEIWGGLNTKKFAPVCAEKKNAEEDSKKSGGGFEKKMRRRI